jgi:Holliday junction resolvasome RuvABC endonuclease subunit
MKRIFRKHNRILAIAPSTRGFGFALLEGQETLVDWGVKQVKGDKNAQCLVRVEELISLYQPDLIVLESTGAKNSRRAPRIRDLTQKIIALAATRNVRAKMFMREQVRRVFFADGKGTKQALAEILAKRFPEDLSSRVPPKRRPWMSEDGRMDIFDAVALVLVYRFMKAKRMP